MDTKLQGNYLFAASSDQERLWFLQQFDEKLGAAYHIATGFKFGCKIDRVAFQKALNYVIERHESLRTAFIKVDGRLMQVISPRLMVTVSYSSHVSEKVGTRQRIILNEIKNQSNTPFDLSSPGLLRIGLHQEAETLNYVSIVMHHIISDGLSMDIFIKELFGCYEAIVDKLPLNLPPIEVQYADITDWNAKWVGSEEYKKQEKYWHKKLVGSFQEITLPGDKVRLKERNYAGATTDFVIQQELYTGLIERSKQLSVTHFSLLMAAFALQVHYYTGKTNFLIGVPMANRFHNKTLPVIGFFSNTVVVRVNITHQMTIEALIIQIHTSVCETVSNQRFPYNHIVEYVRPERSVNNNSLFQLLFGLFNADEAPLGQKNISSEQLVVDTGLSKLDLSLFLFDEKHSIRGLIEYSTEIFSSERIKQIISDYLSICQRVVSSTQTSIGDLGVLYDAVPIDTQSKLAKSEIKQKEEHQFLPIIANETQLKMQSIWQSILKIQEPIDVYANFFNLGGSSLLVTHLVEEVQRIFEVIISIKSIFLNPTIMHLSEHVEAIVNGRLNTDKSNSSQITKEELMELESILYDENIS